MSGLRVREAVIRLGPLIRRRLCIPFCGAGISVDSGVVTAKDFLKDLGYGGLRWEQGTQTASRLDPSFYRRFVSAFGDSRGSPNNIHRYLAQLEARYYITTNYDRLLERAFHDAYGRRCDTQFMVIQRQRDLIKMHDYWSVCIKLHGDVEEPELLVLTEQQYRQRLTQPTAVDRFVEHLFGVHTVVFLGYSLSDWNIRGFLEATPNAHSTTANKYIVLAQYERERDDDMKAQGVTPIYLDCEVAEVGKAHVDFLQRLWEQREPYAVFTRMTEVQPRTPGEFLERAIAARRDGQLQESARLLEAVMGRSDIEWRDHVGLVPALGQLTVSLHDKLEDWDRIRGLDSLVFEPLFRRLRLVLPDAVHDALVGNYEASVAIAFMRAMDLEGAWRRIERSLVFDPSSTAGADLQIARANILTTRAMIQVARECYGLNAETRLGEARNDLKRAAAIYRRFSAPTTADEAHHVGRFYGARAFLGLACRGRDGGRARRKAVLEDSRRSHDGVNRTRWGRVAGRYCEAYSLFRLAGRDEGESLRKALHLLDEALADTASEQCLARAKIAVLARRIAEEPSLNDAATVKARGATAEEAMHLFRSKHPTIVAGLYVDRWLSLPLN